MLVLVLSPLYAAAQVEGFVEQWVEERGSEADAAELSDMVMQLADQPVNLNDTAVLVALPFLSPFQEQALRNYLTLYGQMLSVDELHMVPGFDSLFVEWLKPMVTVAPFERRRLTLSEVWRQGSHTLVTGMGGTVERAAGYDDGRYEGDNLRALACYRFAFGQKIVFQMSADKDPGEAWGKDNFFGYSLTVNDIGRLDRLVVGHFNVQFGQGVTLWTGFSPFSLTGSAPVRFAGGVKAASAFSEEGRMHGVAATVRMGGGWRLSAFGSRANGEWTGGGHLTWRHANLIVGLTAVGSMLDDSVRLRDYVYNQDYFRGDRAGTVGFDMLWQYGGLMFFGEAATDDEGHLAALGGARISAGGDNSFGLTLRHFDALYHSLHASAYAIGETRNEQGVSFDARIQLPLRVRLLVSADVHRFPSLRYGSYAPSTGAWLRVQAERTFARHIEVSLRYALRDKQRNIPGLDSSLYLSEATWRHQWQGQLRLTLGGWRFSTRVMGVLFDGEVAERQVGWLVAQEVRYACGRWQATVQAAWHDIDGYNARIYLSESNLQYVYTLPSLQGRGLRMAAVVRCDVVRWLNLSLKYTLTARPGEEAIGSGAAATQGPLRQTWHLQARLKL